MGGGPGGRRPAELPGRAWHRADLGSPRARGRRADRRPGRRDADPPRRQDRFPHGRRRPAGRARRPVRRAHRRQPCGARRAAAPGRIAGRLLPPGDRGRYHRSAAGVRPRGKRHPAGAGREPPLLAGNDADRSRHRVEDHPGVRRHRRAHRHPRRDGTPPRAAAAGWQRQPEPPDLRVRAGRRGAPAHYHRPGQRARRAQPAQRRARLPGPSRGGGAGRRSLPCPVRGGRHLAAAELSTSSRRCTRSLSSSRTTC